MEYNATITNRKAKRDFFVIETIETGLELKGSEVKSLREGKASLAESFARPEGRDIFLYHMHISPYIYAGKDQDPYRPKKLLLHRKEIDYLTSQVSQKKLALIPLKLYFRNGYAKVELALAKGKREYDKREAIKKREADKVIARAKRARLE